MINYHDVYPPKITTSCANVLLVPAFLRSTQIHFHVIFPSLTSPLFLPPTGRKSSRGASGQPSACRPPRHHGCRRRPPSCPPLSPRRHNRRWTRRRHGSGALRFGIRSSRAVGFDGWSFRGRGRWTGARPLRGLLRRIRAWSICRRSLFGRSVSGRRTKRGLGRLGFGGRPSGDLCRFGRASITSGRGRGRSVGRFSASGSIRVDGRQIKRGLGRLGLGGRPSGALCGFGPASIASGRGRGRGRSVGRFSAHLHHSWPRAGGSSRWPIVCMIAAGLGPPHSFV